MTAGVRTRLAMAAMVAMAAIAAMAAAWMYPMREPDAPEVRPRPADPVGTAPPRAATREITTAGATATAAAPWVVLTGVAVGADGGNLALVSVDHRPEVLLRVGDAVTPAATVVSIDDGSMTYRHAGIDVRVSIQAVQPGGPVVKPAAPPKTYPGFVAGAPAVARAHGTEPGSGNEAFRQAIEKKQQAISAGR